MPALSPDPSSPFRASFATQLVALIAGIVACVAGMLGLIAQWDRELATVQFLLLAIAPVVWMIHSRRQGKVGQDSVQTDSAPIVWLLAFLVGLTSFTTCFLVGRSMVNLPPAYHDEYSYLFEARCLLSGCFSVPSHPTHPELFDQMHVLNEGRMASRYYPGTAAWLSPFVAIGHPYWGHWLASAIASIFVYWTGYEIGRLRVAVVSGFVCALSPGIALFGNLLLAHQPTMAALSLFMWAFVKWQRTRSPQEAMIAGCALSYAMLCRPATAAGIGFPFGIVFLYWLVMGDRSQQSAMDGRRVRSLVAMGLPLVAGWILMLAYHRDVTGHWLTSPYQLYTDIYTPKHVYGFDNAVRGQQNRGPKVNEAYDRWAVNLTPQLAVENTFNRWIASWTWTFDFLPQLICTIVVLGAIGRIDQRWTAIGLSIVSLHALHIPYWYAGIMGWHYVFESVLPWCLLIGLGTDLLLTDWKLNRRKVMPVWWGLLLLVSVAGNYLPVRALIPVDTSLPKIAVGVGTIQYPRRRYADFDRWLESAVKRPALVLIEIDPDDQHMDYVVTTPRLDDAILRARFYPGKTDLGEVSKSFPDRSIYLVHPKNKEIEFIR